MSRKARVLLARDSHTIPSCKAVHCYLQPLSPHTKKVQGLFWVISSYLVMSPIFTTYLCESRVTDMRTIVRALLPTTIVILFRYAYVHHFPHIIFSRSGARGCGRAQSLCRILSHRSSWGLALGSWAWGMEKSIILDHIIYCCIIFHNYQLAKTRMDVW